MSTQIQRRRGTTVQHSSFTGAAGETTIDTDKEVVVVHDGVQVGGYPQMRENGSNSALALGSAGTPSLKFTGDTNTGIYSSGADQVSVATNGTERLRVDSTGQIEAVSLGTAAAPVYSFTTDPNTGIYSPGADQVAISTNNNGRLFVDASGNVGVGAANSTTTRLEVARLGAAWTGLTPVTGTALVTHSGGGSAASPANLNILGGNTSAGGIYFGDTDASSKGAVIYDHATDALWFGTNGSNERMRLDSTGRLGLGTSSPDGKLTIQSSGNSTFVTNWKNSSGTNIGYFYQDGSGNGAFYVNDSAAAQKVLLNSNGASYFTGGSLGIGTTSPSTLFHLSQTGSTQAGLIETNQSASVINFKSTGQSSGQPQVGCAGSDMIMLTNGSERGRWDSSGRFLVGTSSARSNFFNTTLSANLQVEGTDHDTSSMTCIRNSANTGSPSLSLCKTRGTSNGSNTAAQNGDDLGFIAFQGADGTDFVAGAYIYAQVDGTPGANDMPGRLVFSTTADGASSPTERWRIDSAGSLVGVAGSAFVAPYVYNNTTGTAANVNVDASGFLRRSTSSLKYKDNVQDATHGLTELLQLRSVTYTGKAATDGSTVFGGLIAEEVDAVGLSEFVQYAEDGSPDALAYGNMVSLCIKAIQEQQAVIEELQAKVAALEAS
jgi:hypothetical protein